ncbi:MAG: helix-turn-helix transcriptional regulator [Firmicutes bacterium]|nr:helix-turn-helix transcriptional regulator [Bacillota bacterium]
MELGKRINEIRKDHGLTQEGLAEICSVTRQTISNWENGKSYPDLEILVLISDTFDVSLDALLKGDRKMVSEITKEQKHGKNFAGKLIISIVLTIAIVIGAYSILYTHETFVPYEESGVTVSDNGAMYTDRNYSCYYGSFYVTETVEEEKCCVEFVYLTRSIYSQYFEKKPGSRITIANYSEPPGQINDNGKVYNEIITEVYYLPEKYVVEQGLLKGKHAQLIPANTSEEEAQSIIQQIKEDSVLLWKRDRSI